MKNWFPVFNIIALVCLMFMTDSLYRQIDLYENEYNEQRLVRSVEYASQMAFYDTIGTRNNEVDYDDTVQAVLDPKDTLVSFCTMMEMNYGLSINDESHVEIEDSIGAMILAADDGYYIANLTETADGQYRLYWSPKLPYSYETKSSGTVYTYAVHLCDEDWVKVTSNKSTGSCVVKSGDSYADTELSGALTTQIAKQTISNTLTDALAYSLDHNALNEDESEYGTYIPSQQTMTGINEIAAPTMLVVIRNAGYAGCSGTLDAATTGYKVIKKIRVIGYIDPADNNRKKYSYETQGASDKYEILEYFNTTEDAAKAGYQPDYRYIFEKKVMQ